MIPTLACKKETTIAFGNFDQEDICILYSHPSYFADNPL
jgi:hypothetical protein